MDQVFLRGYMPPKTYRPLPSAGSLMQTRFCPHRGRRDEIVFLAVHGVEREHPAAQPQRGDQGLHGWDFVRLLVDDLMGEDDLMVDRERAEDVRRLAVRKGVEALPQRLPVDRDEPRRGGGAGSIEPFRMASERPLQFGRIEC